MFDDFVMQKVLFEIAKQIQYLGYCLGGCIELYTRGKFSANTSLPEFTNLVAVEWRLGQELVDETGVEPATSSLRTMRSPS